jgi:hypothetical protein
MRWTVYAKQFLYFIARRYTGINIIAAIRPHNILTLNYLQTKLQLFTVNDRNSDTNKQI